MLRALSLHCRRQLGQHQRLVQARNYNFASTRYVECFGNLPSTTHMDEVRADTISYMKGFDETLWFRDPVCTIINGDKHSDGETVDTPDAFENIVGKLILAPPSVVDAAISHMQTFKAKNNDLRAQIRAVEAVMLSENAAALVGNQAMDFRKQDGITEIEESLEANEVERRLNDALFADEQAGRVEIKRAPAMIGCVSNFSNFLDLCRKTLRNLELGIPVVILSRSNTTQHMYRWATMLMDECEKQGVHPGMITYVACSIEEQRRIMAANSASPLYLTGSRPVAAAIKELLPATFASTGGPNTMVTTRLDDDIKAAIKMSSMIENSGQCTAMRHLVAPNVDNAFMEEVFSNSSGIESSVESLEAKGFAEFFKGWASTFEQLPGYNRVGTDVPAAYKINDHFPEGIEEEWRRIYLDVTSVESADEIVSDKFCKDLSEWLVTEQPITLSVNRDDPTKGYPLASKLFEQTSQVVYSVGTEESPSLTCQARPQEGEIFGEFPPRREMSRFTKFPVIVPSPTPGYNTTYSAQFLDSQSSEPASCQAEEKLRTLASNASTNGYMRLLAEYLEDAAVGPHEGFGPRTTLWGLQRPPLNGKSTEIRIEKDTTIDDVLVNLLPFALTNAIDQVSISVAPDSPLAESAAMCTLESVLSAAPKVESASQFTSRVEAESPWNVVHPCNDEFALVGHFISVLFPLGHIKSTVSNDHAFTNHFKQSPKWLRFQHH